MYDSMILVRHRVWGFWGGLVVALTGCANSGHAPAMSDFDSECESTPCTLTNLEATANDTIEVTPAGSGSDATWNDSSDEVCASDVIETTLAPVNLFLMVDRSGSMSQNNKWRQAVSGLKAFLKDPETAGLRVALRFFSDDEPMAGCTMQGCSIDACAEPLVRVDALVADAGELDAQEVKLVDALDHTFPRSGLGTPIYPALGGALQWASTYRTEHPSERTVVVLVTDGEPNGCNQDIGDISALAAQAAANFEISTYAIGLEGSNEAQLDRIASAGHTTRGIFIGANTNAESELLRALNTIRGQTMSCDFALPVSTSGKAADPNHVNVNLSSPDGSVGLFRVDSAADCVGGRAAWYYDNPTAPSRIHLCPSACEAAGQVADIDVAMGCIESRREAQTVR